MALLRLFHRNLSPSLGEAIAAEAGALHSGHFAPAETPGVSKRRKEKRNARNDFTTFGDDFPYSPWFQSSVGFGRTGLGRDQIYPVMVTTWQRQLEGFLEGFQSASGAPISTNFVDCSCMLCLNCSFHHQ